MRARVFYIHLWAASRRLAGLTSDQQAGQSGGCSRSSGRRMAAQGGTSYDQLAEAGSSSSAGGGGISADEPSRSIYTPDGRYRIDGSEIG